MGGNAIKGAERLTRVVYLKICDLLVSCTSKYYNSGIMFTLPVKSKESFGDIDCIVVGRIPDFPGMQIVRNGPSFTSIGFEYEGSIYQVDVFSVKTVEEQRHLRSYLSYGIFGMCVGISMKVYDLRYGVNGLEMKVAEGIYLKLSSNAKDIFDFLGLDIDVFEQGFKDVTADTTNRAGQ